jgi:pyruvate formate lyase activating enzyme
MLIAGLQKNSLVDYRGKVAAVVFVPFCNFDCYYCHNRILLDKNQDKRQYKVMGEKYFFDFLDKRVELIQGVVVTGGEPTLHNDLIEFIKKIKDRGFPVKLDSNGYRPDVIKNLIESGLLDSIAMDAKAPFEKYGIITGVEIDIDLISDSIDIIKNSGLDYEFRTTVTPDFALEDIEAICNILEGSRRYVLQQFRKPDKVEGFADIRNSMKPKSKEFFKKAERICSGHFDEVILRGIGI